MPSCPHSRPVRVLYAEDLRELRDLASTMFSREGHVVECAVDGMDALDLLATRDGYELVITDHHMPRMDGLELVANLRKQHYGGKIVVFSSELTPSLTAEYERLEVDRVLYKPLHPLQLRSLMSELFPEPAPEHATSLRDVGNRSPIVTSGWPTMV